MNYDESSSHVFEDKELLQLYLPILRSDFKIVETYRYTEPVHKISCGINAFTGKQDRSLMKSEVKEWRKHTTGPFILHEFDGGHFFLHDYPQQIVNLISYSAAVASHSGERHK